LLGRHVAYVTPLPSPRTLFESSLPVAVTLLFWAMLSWVGVASVLGDGARGAGLAMGALAAVAAGRSLAPSVTIPAWNDLSTVFRVNVRVGVAVLGWVAVALVVDALGHNWERFGLPGLFTSPVADLHWALTWTAVGTGVVYAVAVAVSMHRTPARRDAAAADGG
jgi:hypothetical protein